MLLTTVLPLLAGVCLYAAVHHLWLGLRRPVHVAHVWFAVLGVVAACYLLVKLGAYHATAPQELVGMRRAEGLLVIVFFAALPWFAARYCDLRGYGMALSALNAVGLALFIANLTLPYGMFFPNLPEIQTLLLPWGERITDLRVHHRSNWFQAGLLYVFASFALSLAMCARHYRQGERSKAVELAATLGLFLILVLFNQLVNFGLVNFVHTAEFGFVAMIILMSSVLSHELHTSGEALLASESRFRALVEQSPLGIQVLAPDGRTLQVNRAWEALWGISIKDLSKHNILRDPVLTEQGLLPYFERGFNGEPVAIPPISYRAVNGPAAATAAPLRDLWARAFIYPVKDTSGCVREVIVMYEDITERKWMEDAIHHIAAGVSARTGEDFFNHLVLHLAALFEADYAFVGLLDGGQSRSIETLAACASGAIVPNMQYELNDTPCANVVGQATCTYPSGVQQLFPKDRMLTDMGVDGYIGTPLFDTQQSPIGLIVVLSKKPLKRAEQARQILEIFAARTAAEIQRLRAERELEAHKAALENRVRERTAQLEAANKELEAFCYSVSHDLRAPLRAVDGFSHALLDDYAASFDDTARDYAARIREGTQRMSALIEDLLNLSRVTRAPLNREAVDLSRMAQEVVDELQRGEPDRAVRVTIASGLTATGDTNLLRVAMHNLLGNAWKYTRNTASPHIEFGQTIHDATRCLFVRDNGVGFDMQYAGKLFVPFQRLHGPHEFEGTGIGLASVARIVQRHGGRVWVNAEPGHGATFYFTLEAIIPKTNIPRKNAATPELAVH
ncbi:MAG: ATP-binding protein [Gammaproteobacteria bacterium]|nr:ATP-binding protein [Gammaproteobacteria bacterium]